MTEYRLTLSNRSSGEEIKGVSFSGPRAFLAISAGVIVAVGLIYCLIAFTPIRNSIPGYPDAHARKTAVANAIKIDSLESIITRWELYTENLNRVLAGTETISLDSIIRGNAVKYLSAKSREELARQDSLLRLSVDAGSTASSSAEDTGGIEGLHFFAPVKGAIAKSFDLASHPGVDITGADGTAVCAALDGTIVSTSWSDTDGYTIVIQHGGNAITIYSHIEKLLKEAGAKVKTGTPLALLGGSTGTLEAGTHLHFELWHDGEPQDPSKHISFQ